MAISYGARDISRNPSLLRIDDYDNFLVEDKKSHKKLGLYIGMGLAKEFLEYREKKRLLDAAHKIKQSAISEYISLESSLDDGI